MLSKTVATQRLLPLFVKTRTVKWRTYVYYQIDSNIAVGFYEVQLTCIFPKRGLEKTYPAWFSPRIIHNIPLKHNFGKDHKRSGSKLTPDNFKRLDYCSSVEGEISSKILEPINFYFVIIFDPKLQV